MVNLVSMFPAEWRCNAIRERGGGWNADGDPAEPDRQTLPDVMVASRATAEPVDRRDNQITTAVLYAAPGVDVTDADTIEIPSGHRMSGRWAVDGHPSEWPLGTEIPLRRI